MPIYEVVSKATGVKVYRYDSPEAIEWAGMEFETHDHNPLPAPDPEPMPVSTGITLSKVAYLRRFSQEERVSIRNAAKTSAVLEDYIALLELAEEVRTDDEDILQALNMLEAVGLLAPGRATEILS